MGLKDSTVLFLLHCSYCTVQLHFRHHPLDGCTVSAGSVSAIPDLPDLFYRTYRVCRAVLCRSAVADVSVDGGFLLVDLQYMCTEIE